MIDTRILNIQNMIQRQHTIGTASDADLNAITQLVEANFEKWWIQEGFDEKLQYYNPILQKQFKVNMKLSWFASKQDLIADLVNLLLQQYLDVEIDNCRT